MGCHQLSKNAPEDEFLAYRTSSVLEIYNDMKFRFMREELTAQEGVHPCNNCSLLQ
jgi:hypothetical protein